MLPPHLGRFVAADVDVFRRKKFHHFVQHRFQKCQRRVLSGAVNILEYAPVVRHLHGFTGAPQPRVGRQGCSAVARELDFRNDFDVALGRIGDDIADLLLGIKPAVLAAICLRAPCALLGQFGVGIDFNAPPLVFRQVPMQHAHFVQRQQIDGALHKFRFHKMPATIQQQSPVAESGRIGKVAARQRTVAR